MVPPSPPSGLRRARAVKDWFANAQDFVPTLRVALLRSRARYVEPVSENRGSKIPNPPKARHP